MMQQRVWEKMIGKEKQYWAVNDGSLSSEAPQNYRMQLMKGEKNKERVRERDGDRQRGGKRDRQRVR